MKKSLALYLLFLTLTQISFAQTTLYINEFMAANVLTLSDNDGEYDDWIEIYNPNDFDINIGGYYLSDDIAKLAKWQVPTDRPDSTTVPARGYLLFWADEHIQQGLLHAEFKLSKESETILFSESDGITLIDSISYARQVPDVSFGRFPDGSPNWGYCPSPSPGRSNTEAFTAFAETPEIIETAGFYSYPITVSIKPHLPEDTVYYSLDGSAPNKSNLRYSAPIMINQTAVLRARTIRSRLAPSEIVTKSFFINSIHSLPVLSLVTDPGNLFNDSSGIYVNPEMEGREWERKVVAQYFTQGVLQFDLAVGLRIQGNTGRKMDKKSFRLFFREGYGHDQLEYSMFENTPINIFQTLILRAGYDDDLMKSAGTLLRDPLITELWRRLGCLTSHSQLAVLCLNGVFWGIYDIHEDIDDHFINAYLNLNDFDMIRLRYGYWELAHGQKDDWEELLPFFRNNDFESDSMFSEAASRIDIDNFTTLQALAHATQYHSWTYGASAFKAKNPAAKWQWTIWDMDRAYTQLNWNGFYYYEHRQNEYWINVIIQKLLQNKSYRHYFINRLCDLLNSMFLPDHVLPILDSLAASIEAEIPAEAEKWNSSTEKWESNLTNLRSFIAVRPTIVRQQMMDYFNLSEPVQITLNVPDGGGTIRVNSINVNSFPWTGFYFRNVPFEVTAQPNEGYQFSSWSDSTLPQTEKVTIYPADNYSLNAKFKLITNNDTEIIIPTRAMAGGMLPVVARLRNQQGKIDPLVDAVMEVRSQTGKVDTCFTIKKGVGSIVLPVKDSADLMITLQCSELFAAQKTIIVNNSYPSISYSGILPIYDLIWSADTNRIIADDLTIPVGCQLTIQAGSWILLKKFVNIFVYGSLIVEGFADNPVVFISENWQEPWGGIEFYHTMANFQYTFFLNGGADPEKGWAHTGRQSILFAKDDSELSLNNCFILNSPGKGLGARDSKVNVSECLTAFVFHGGEYHYTLLNYKDSHIMNIPNDDGIFKDEDSDGFHIDYVYPNSREYSVIENCYIITGKDDAIDHHNSRLKIINCWLNGWMHEGVAASGGDTVKVCNTVVQNCEQGIETGWTEGNVATGPHVFVDHCVVIDNDTGLRFGDSYDWSYRGHMTVTNTIVYHNQDNIRNYLNSTHASYKGGIEISFSMTNDADYDSSAYCITGVPEFDRNYFLLPNSPGVGLGMNGTNLGLIDSIALKIGPMIITEIMYNAHPDWNSKDWIELYNPQPIPLNVSRWLLKDGSDNHAFRLPESIILPSEGYWVICEDSSAFKQIHPNEKKFIGNFNFGFGRGDQVRLFSPIEQLADSVAYNINAPWPELADGKGYSLALKNIMLDNSLAENWEASLQKGGTPGEPNSGFTEIENVESIFQQSFDLQQNYPNPFNAATQINYYLPKPAKVTISMYNILGQKIMNLINEKNQTSGRHTVLFNATDYPGGIYFCQITAQFKNNTVHKKSIKLLLMK